MPFLSSQKRASVMDMACVSDGQMDIILSSLYRKTKRHSGLKKTLQNMGNWYELTSPIIENSATWPVRYFSFGVLI